jgi:hypothetical protein
MACLLCEVLRLCLAVAIAAGTALASMAISHKGMGAVLVSSTWFAGSPFLVRCLSRSQVWARIQELVMRFVRARSYAGVNGWLPQLYSS